MTALLTTTTLTTTPPTTADCQTLLDELIALTTACRRALVAHDFPQALDLIAQVSAQAQVATAALAACPPPAPPPAPVDPYAGWTATGLSREIARLDQAIEGLLVQGLDDTTLDQGLSALHTARQAAQDALTRARRTRRAEG